MTEIPEHLLQRSKARRAAIGGGESTGDAAPSDPAAQAPAAAVEAAPTPAVPAAPEPPPAPEPVRPEVEARLRRRRIPYWAMPVLAGLPLWAYVYQGTLEPPPSEDNSPLALGGQIYASAGCSGCHGANGAGSATVPGFEAVVETWPDYRDHMMWVRVGSPGWPGDSYGAEDKAKTGSLMPEHPGLSDQELAQVVLYERTQFAGEEEADQEELLAVASGELTFADVGLGPLAEDAGVDPAKLEAG
ncbi:MAG: cytochrome c [Acidimicrobiia bacterium]